MFADNNALLAARTMLAAPGVVRRRVELEDADVDGWGDHDAHRRFIDQMASIHIRVEGDPWNRSVVAEPGITFGNYWKGTAAEILDRAYDEVVTGLAGRWQAPVRPWEFRLPTAQIENHGSHGARLTWQTKPNIERAHWKLWQGRAPMVAVVVDGRTHYLGWDAQNLAVTVANRYSDRHDYSHRVYAQALRLLAGQLGVDPETAQRITNVVVPDRCGIDYDRNEALRILSAAEETQRRAGRVAA